jgi:predicted dehydrogenase
MDYGFHFGPNDNPQGYSRRLFLGGALGAAATASLWESAAAIAADTPAPGQAKPQTFDRKLKLGLVGCGGRGNFLAKLFQQHGGYELHAVTDYFPRNSARTGKLLGVDPRRCFSGLSGYKKVIESGIEAIALEVPTCFFADHSAAAIDAGIHVYMAKPIAVDVPSCTRILAAGKQATAKHAVFLVDYQMPTEPINIEVARRVRQGEIGKLLKVVTTGCSGGHVDPPRGTTIENRLEHNIWDNDIAIGGSSLLCFDIHAIDAAVWVLGQRPIAAMGISRVCRADPHSDGADIGGVVYEYAGGLIHEHSGQHVPNGVPGELSCKVFGQNGYAVVNYWHDTEFHVRGRKPLTGTVNSLYPNGAARNIATFYDCITQGKFDNPTVPRAVDGALTCILGREAGLRHGRLTMDELLRENKRIEADLAGLKD